MRSFLLTSSLSIILVLLVEYSVQFHSVPSQSHPASQAAFNLGPLSSTNPVIIVSNNDLDPSNANRAGALLLKTSLACSQAVATCAALQETLLPFPQGGIGFTTEDLIAVLTSDRHGAALGPSSRVWIAGHSGFDCAAFSLVTSSPSSYDDTMDPSTLLPVLCTNSAPLTRSNVTSYDTARQIDVSTPKAGILRGFRDKFTWRFLGIKYATSTAGRGRFQPPTPLNVSPDTVRTALAYSPFCAQAPAGDNSHMLHIEEDCLSLNVYSPIVGDRGGTSPKLPVMFFIHGGGLNSGGNGPVSYNMTTSGYVGNSTANVYDGTNLVSYGGIVLVTIEYRLNAFGWFNASNTALKDVLLALSWVQDNIESFGGDPARVLIFGQSAGGVMTRYLLATNTKYTQGLFSSAILVSDFSTTFPFYSPAHALDTSLTLAKHLDCASSASTLLSDTAVTCVQSKSAEQIVLAAHDHKIKWNAVIDGDYILDDIASSIRNDVYPHVPTLWTSTECDICNFFSSTLSPTAPPSAYVEALRQYFNQTQIAKILNETTFYPYETAPAEGGMSGTVATLARLLTDWLVLCPSTYLAALESNTTNPNAYHAVFAVGLGSPFTPNAGMCRGRVCHADELYWIFGTAETDGLYQPLSAQHVEVTRGVIKRWTEMAWRGTPNYVGAKVVWEGYGAGNEAVVDVTESVRLGYRAAQCDFIVNELGLVYGDGPYPSE